MESSLGANHLYYDQLLSANHDSNRTFIEVTTDPIAVKSSVGISWIDGNVNSNCKIHSTKYSAWTDTFT